MTASSLMAQWSVNPDPTHGADKRRRRCSSQETNAAANPTTTKKTKEPDEQRQRIQKPVGQESPRAHFSVLGFQITELLKGLQRFPPAPPKPSINRLTPTRHRIDSVSRSPDPYITRAINACFPSIAASNP
jgi:hypothetical protein